MTLYRGGFGSVEWLVDHCCPQLSFDFSEKHRRQTDATTWDVLKLNKMIRSAESIECKLKVSSIPINHLRFVEVHGAGHAKVGGGASQHARVILAVHEHVRKPKGASIKSESSKQIKSVVCSSLAPTHAVWRSRSRTFVIIVRASRFVIAYSMCSQESTKG